MEDLPPGSVLAPAKGSRRVCTAQVAVTCLTLDSGGASGSESLFVKEMRAKISARRKIIVLLCGTVGFQEITFTRATRTIQEAHSAVHLEFHQQKLNSSFKQAPSSQPPRTPAAGIS
jgi:hypothetical protein